MDDYTPPKPKSILTRFRHAVAFVLEVSAFALAIPIALLAFAGAAIGGLSTLRELAQDSAETFSGAKDYIKLLYMEYIA